MKKLLLLYIFTIVAFTVSCSSSSDEDKNLKVLKWGPDQVKAGTVPNKQPDGKMGLWIDVSSTEGIGEVQILVEGRPSPTAIQPKTITTGIAPEELSVVGDKKIEIKVNNTGQIIPVGVLKVTP